MTDDSNLPVPTNKGASLLVKKLDKMMGALPTESELTRTRFAQISVAIANSAKLADCDANSVVNSIYGCARLGLIPDPALGQVWILPRNIKRVRTAQIVVGYRGYIELAHRSGEYMGINAEPVYDNDDFDLDEGTARYIKHKPWWLVEGMKTPGDLRAAYAIAYHKSGHQQWKAVSREEVLKHKAASESSGSEYSPWTKWELSMWCKTAVVVLSKYLRLSAEFNLAVQWDEQLERGVVQTVEPIAGDTEPLIPTDQDPLMKELNGDSGEGDGAPPSGDPPPDAEIPQEERDEIARREADEAHNQEP